MKSIVSAVTPSGVIGRDGSMPWHYPEDLKWFQSLTVNHTVVMGRKTYESLPSRFQPLPNRDNIVLSRTVESTPFRDMINQHTGKQSRLRFALEIEDSDIFLRNDVFFVGGAEIYKLALPIVDRIFITRIPKEHDGDTYFPCWPLEDHGWDIATVHGKTDSGLEFLEYRRK